MPRVEERVARPGHDDRPSTDRPTDQEHAFLMIYSSKVAAITSARLPSFSSSISERRFLVSGSFIFRQEAMGKRVAEKCRSVRLHQVFDLFDCNRDGEITPAELGQVLCRLGLDAEAQELKTSMEAFVKPGHGGLDFDDFATMDGAMESSVFSGIDAGEDAEPSDLREAFRVFDEDGDGFISAGELQSVLRKLGFPEGRSMGRVNEMISSVDANRDGRVDFQEFKNMIHRISPMSSS